MKEKDAVQAVNDKVEAEVAAAKVKADSAKANAKRKADEAKTSLSEQKSRRAEEEGESTQLIPTTI